MNVEAKLYRSVKLAFEEMIKQGMSVEEARTVLMAVTKAATEESHLRANFMRQSQKHL